MATSEVILLLLAVVTVAATVLVGWLWRRAYRAGKAAERAMRPFGVVAEAAREAAAHPDAADEVVLRALGVLSFDEAAVLMLDEPAGRWVHRRDTVGAPVPVEGTLARAADHAWSSAGAVALPDDGRTLHAAPVPSRTGIAAVLVAWGRAGADVALPADTLLTTLGGLLGAAHGSTDRRRGDRESQPAPAPGSVDSLTGLETPSAFREHLRRRCTGGNGPVALLLVSVDGVGDVAGELGWRSGEEVLRIAARRLSRCLRPDDHLARVEPTVFGALLADPTDPDAVASVAARVLSVLDAPVAVTGGEVEVQVRASVGWDASDDPDPVRLLHDTREGLWNGDGTVTRTFRMVDSQVRAGD